MVRFVDPMGLSRGSQVPLYGGECLVASWASPSDCARLEAASEGGVVSGNCVPGERRRCERRRIKRRRDPAFGCASRTQIQRRRRELFCCCHLFSFFFFSFLLCFSSSPLFFLFSRLVSSRPPPRRKRVRISSLHRRRCHAQLHVHTDRPVGRTKYRN